MHILWEYANTVTAHLILFSRQSTKGKKARNATNALNAHTMRATITDSTIQARPRETQNAPTLREGVRR
jgi:hypothetical protein